MIVAAQAYIGRFRRRQRLTMWIGPNGESALVKLVRFCRSRQGTWRGNGPIGETQDVRLFGLYPKRKQRRVFRFLRVGFEH